MHLHTILEYKTDHFLRIWLNSFQTGVESELVESLSLLEWFANNYKSFGAMLEIVTDKSQEGSQFVKGFGGIGGTVLPAKSDSDVMFCLQSYQGLIIDRSLVY